MGEEIANAITSAPIGEPVDEDELNEELAELEQEQLDNRMLKTGTVPVSDEIHRLPAAANGESKACKFPLRGHVLTVNSQGQSACLRGRRRGGRTTEVTSRDGNVETAYSIQFAFSATQYLDMVTVRACIRWVVVILGNIGFAGGAFRSVQKTH